MTLHFRPDLVARALPMGGTVLDPVDHAAARLGVPILRLIDGRPTIVRPTEEI
jgi:hypothetical protein